MCRFITAAITILLGSACDPGADPGEAEPPGELEYEGGVNRIHRLDHRVDLVPVDDPVEGRKCGFLTDRAYRELQGAIEGLDPAVDYDFERGTQECGYSESPAAQVYVRGLEYSPFSCDELCCRPELAAIPRVYLHVANNLAGIILEVDGEPYVAIDPDQPCS